MISKPSVIALAIGLLTPSLASAVDNDWMGQVGEALGKMGVNKHRSVTPPMSNGSAAYRADRRRDPAPNHT